MEGLSAEDATVSLDVENEAPHPILLFVISRILPLKTLLRPLK